MADREKLAKELEFYMKDDPVRVPYALLDDIYSELLRDDEAPYGIKVPESHIDRVLKKYQFYISQLQVCEEECSELIKAISKNIRITQGTTELTKEEARAMIVEEMTHVVIALHMLQKIYDIEQEEIDVEIAKKAAELDAEGL